MAWVKTHDICVKTEPYKQDGILKFRFANVGKVLSDGTKEIYILDRTFNPAGAFDDGKGGVVLFMFEAKERARYPDPAKPRTQEELDDMPF